MPVTMPPGEQVTACVLSGDDYAPAMLYLIESARESIDLAAFSVTPRWPARGSQRFNLFRAFECAPARGLRCTAVLATHKPHSPNAAFNWQAAAKLSAAGWRLRWAPAAHLLHAKCMIVDGRRAVVGSHNIAHSAITSNIDLSVALDYTQPGGQTSKWFAELLKKSTSKHASAWHE